MELRPYQREAIDALYNHMITRETNPCIVIPTAGGKTPVLATLCKEVTERWAEWHPRILIVAHVKELLEQAADKLQRICPDVDFGIYSAGLKSRDTDSQVIIAGIQSVYKRACEIGKVDLIIVDEAHLIPPSGEGMYQTLISQMQQINPYVRVIGLTATPYRLTSGDICAPDHILHEVCYEVGVKELIVQGYISKVRTKSGELKANLDGVHMRGGEFIETEMAAAMDNAWLVQSAVEEIIQYTKDARNSTLIFAASVQHAEHIVEMFDTGGAGIECGIVTGDTPAGERAATLERFCNGDLKYLANVNVLTTGFDAPNIDCVAIMRATLSPGLYYQMVGRGFRLHPGKEDCLVLDFGENATRHGPVDKLSSIAQRASGSGSGEAPAKECPQCHEVVPCGLCNCSACGFEFPPREIKHEAVASTEEIISGEEAKPTTEKYTVEETLYSVHRKRGAPPDAPKSMRVDYHTGDIGSYSEWICVEHDGYARGKAESWWRVHSVDGTSAPMSAEDAVAIAESGGIYPTVSITVKHNPRDDFPRIIAYELDDLDIKKPEKEIDCPF